MVAKEFMLFLIALVYKKIVVLTSHGFHRLNAWRDFAPILYASVIE